jgi:short-subunit dehydrogenase
LQVDLLVNNAGFGLGGAFLSHDLSWKSSKLTDVSTLVALTHLYVRDVVVPRRERFAHLRGQVHK